ncbi:MAG: polyphosphate kinase 1 [Armatimonadetes bacterium]|nr:polyphosphate kinase 1 [Armatimonadota bacterium]
MERTDPHRSAHREFGSEAFFNRGLSAIAFNRRVLEMANDATLPPLERMKCIAIASSILDENFDMGMSGLKANIRDGHLPSLDGLTPRDELNVVRAAVADLLRARAESYAAVLALLNREKVFITRYDALDETCRATADRYFENEVFGLCTPQVVDPHLPFPFITGFAVYLAALVERHGEHTWVIVEMPREISRMVRVGADTFIFLEDLIARRLEVVLPGDAVQEVHTFLVMRDAEIHFDESGKSDLGEAVHRAVARRRFGAAVAVRLCSDVPDDLRAWLIEKLDLEPDDIYISETPQGLEDLTEVYRAVQRPDLKFEDFQPVTPPEVAIGKDIFEAIRQGDVLLRHPVESFDVVVRLLEQAVRDPDVLAIKQTLYRIGDESPLVPLLIEGVDRGKKVCVVVEIKAHFEEARNLETARQMYEAGVQVSYGFAELNTHSKLLLLLRREGGHTRCYAHLASGNYNAGTARLYTDFALLTCRDDVTRDCLEVFNFITAHTSQNAYRTLLVAPMTMHGELIARIEREVARHAERGDGRLIFKVNSLQDPDVIAALYRASRAGVRCELIVRGICCLRPGVAGLSENIRVISILGRFLEHSRAYYFHNGGGAEVFIGSADPVPRKLDRRVETLVPVEEPIRPTILALLEDYLRSTAHTYALQPDGRYAPVTDAHKFDIQASLLKTVAGVSG